MTLALVWPRDRGWRVSACKPQHITATAFEHAAAAIHCPCRSNTGSAAHHRSWPLQAAAGCSNRRRAAASAAVDEPPQRSTSCRRNRHKDAQKRALGARHSSASLSNAKPGRRVRRPALTTNGGGRALVTGATGGIGEEVSAASRRGHDAPPGVATRRREKPSAEAARGVPVRTSASSADLNQGEAALPRGVNLLVNNAESRAPRRDDARQPRRAGPADPRLRARNRKLRVVNVASSSHLRARACPVARMLDDRRRDKSLSAYAASEVSLPCPRQRCATMASTRERATQD